MASQHNKTPADIRETFTVRRSAIAWVARIPDFKAVCAHWHNRFGSCLVLDNARLRALRARLIDDGWQLDAVLAAIEGYHHYVQTDDWHQKNPRAVKTLTSFLQDEKFERFAQDGLGARQVAERQTRAAQAKLDQAAAAKTALTNQVNEAYALMAQFKALSPTEQRDLIHDAYNALSQPMRDIVRKSGKTGLASPLIRAGVLARLKSKVLPVSSYQLPVGGDVGTKNCEPRTKDEGPRTKD